MAINDGFHAIEYDDGDREDHVPPSLMVQLVTPSLYEAIRHHALDGARAALASCTDAFAGKTRLEPITRVLNASGRELSGCASAPSRDVSCHHKEEDPLTTLDKENTVPKKRKKRPSSPVKHRLPLPPASRATRGPWRKGAGCATTVAGHGREKSAECTSILQGHHWRISGKAAAYTREEEEVEEPRRADLHGAELNVQLLDLDPEFATPSSQAKPRKQPTTSGATPQRRLLTTRPTPSPVRHSTRRCTVLKIVGAATSCINRPGAALVEARSSKICLSAPADAPAIGRGRVPVEGRGPRLVVERRNNGSVREVSTSSWRAGPL